MDMFSQFFSATPSVAMMQFGLAGAAAILVFLVLFATRDVLLRSDSFAYQLVCIVLVAALPVLGFLLYLLIRPARTRKQRQVDRDVQIILERMQGSPHHQHQQQQQKKKPHQQAPHAPGFKMTVTKDRA